MPAPRCLPLAILVATFATAGAVAASQSGTTKSGTTYKWTDKNGVVHYGDSVPPEYAKQERAVLNREGVEVRRLDAEYTPEQRAVLDKAAREAAQRKQHDQFLLTTYTSVKDIESLRDERLQLVNGQTRAAELYIDTLNSRLTGLQSRAQLFRPYSVKPDARKMPDELAADLVRTMNELRAQKNLLNGKRTEEAAFVRQFQADIDRYVELTSKVVQR